MLSRLLPSIVLLSAISSCCGSEEGPVAGEDGDGRCEGTDGDAFREIVRGPGGAFMSVWGRSSGDVYAVGGDPGRGSGPAAFHLKDRFWQTLPTAGAAGALNWVFGPGDDTDDPVWMVGQNATVLRHDPLTGQTVREVAPVPDGTMFWGLWGTSDEDLWAVGGRDEGFQLVRRTAAGWQDARADLPDDLAPDVELFKVWGEESGDVWVVGDKATILRRPAGGTAFARVPLPDSFSGQGSFLTVHSDGEGRPTLVGGAGGGVLLTWDGQALQSAEMPEGAPPILNGVRVGPSVLGGVIAVGSLGSLVHGDSTAPSGLQLATESSYDLHAVWIDEKCEVWAAGGDLTSENVGGDGLLLHYGEIVPPKLYRGL